MRFDPLNPARRFRVGAVNEIELCHVADVWLDPDEVVTFRTPSGTESDVTRKTWGYYWTASLNERLPDHGLRPVIVRDRSGKGFLMLVEAGCEEEFAAYCADQGLRPETWLDGR